MIEMRREKRWPIELQLEISSLFKQDNVKVENINAPIEVFDVSKAGIGFRTKSVLPIGYYFNAGLVLGDQGTLNCVVRIIASSKMATRISTAARLSERHRLWTICLMIMRQV